MTAQNSDRLGRRIFWGVVFGVLVYAVLGAVTDLRAVLGSLRTFPVSIFFAALALSVVNYGIRWAKWEYFLRRLDVRIPLHESVVVFLSGLTMSITPGKVGEVLKSFLLQQTHDVPVERTAPIVVAERVTDLFGLIAIAAIGIATFDYGRIALASVFGVLAAAMVVLQFPAAVSRLLDVVELLPYVRRVRPRLDEAYGAMRELVRGVPLLVTTGLSAISWSMEALAFHWIIEALDPTTLQPTLSAFIFSMTTILGAVSFLPGGLGVTEGSMMGALLLFGVFTAKADATTATYLIRLATLWFGVALGVLGLTAHRFLRRAAGPTGPSAH